MDRQPRIVELAPKLLVGMSLDMSRLDDKTGQLWGAFMRRRNEVTNRVTDEYISMQVFPKGVDQLADPAARFSKWAVVEVEDLDHVPDGMLAYTLQAGTYAVFEHNGPATDLSTFTYIFTEWLPGSSDFELDGREHFEILPPGYDARDPNAREQIWIPVKRSG